MTEGYLFIDKPVGVPSFSIVRILKKRLQVKKIGFAGTLDPFSSGLLIVGVGRPFTRHLDQFHSLKKSYRVVMVLGMTTTTLDSYGELQDMDKALDVSKITPAHLNQVLPDFKGTIEQTPPAFSAKKIKGKRLYKMARSASDDELKQIEDDIKPVSITIYDIKVRSFFQSTLPHIELDIMCSKGTYIRSLCRDIAKALGTVGYAKNLRRTSIGNIHVEDAQIINRETDGWMPNFCMDTHVFER